MARPKKQTVDYFPHKCVSGKTLFILEQEFGNNGYAFWFKTLEYLGTKPGHYMDCKDISDFKFLQAKTRTSEDMACSILNLLADLGAIDKELWGNKIIWSDNFVEGLAHVYLNRRVEIPSKPSFYRSKPDGDEVSTSESTHSKVKYSKVKESNIKENKEKSNGELILIHPFSENFIEQWIVWKNYKKDQCKFLYKSILTEQAALTDLINLSKGNEETAIKIINQSIAKGWKGFFELKNQENGTTKNLTPHQQEILEKRKNYINQKNNDLHDF